MQQSESSEPPSPATDRSRGSRVGVVILAAGKGTRMRSRLSKLVHPVAGRPMVRQVVEVARQLDPALIALVVGHEADDVIAAAGPGVEVVVQGEQLGTGHAVLQARDALRGTCDLVAILYADTALLRLETLQQMLTAAEDAALVLLTYLRGHSKEHDAISEKYGRISRDHQGHVNAIIEVPITDAERAIPEVNAGIMVARAEPLWEGIGQLPRSEKGEYYLTDLIAPLVAAGQFVTAVHPDDDDEILGVNTQRELAQVNRIAMQRIRERSLDSGVRMLDPNTVYIDSTVTIEPDVVILPNTHLRGMTSIAAGSEIGPNSIVEDTVIGQNCRVVSSVLEQAWVGNDVTIGPFAHLRPGARIEDGAELGNYAEVKAATIGPRTKVHHFSYIGDATLGADTNVGAGSITCNYDGTSKHRTTVGEGVFIGSDTMLIAPITLGDGARTGAGSVVNRDVAAGQTVVGVPARPIPRRTPATSKPAAQSADESVADQSPEPTADLDVPSPSYQHTSDDHHGSS